ncbi:hypothetical protein B0H17DRAFT_1340972 [Mycena rosella]|uniref:Uncharacterized protein n=1 Tax=Mycena rosella TaxID=1033263 RepID=A0AAD7BCW8_MYCRO|nr:hypothetical protein B0H17DRAFT_1340972 [Mycena rosella]
MPALAQELIDAIIDEVGAKKWADPKDYATLTRCSLTARAFVARSQRCLFQSLTLNTRTANHLSSALAGSPHLASYVCDLHLDLPFANTSVHNPLALLLPHLTRVRRLVKSSEFDERWHWDEFPANFRSALVALFSLPSLRCVGLHDCMGVPSSIIRHALLSCEQVYLGSIEIEPEDAVFPRAEDSVVSSVPLEYLALAYSPKTDVALHALILGDEVAQRLEGVRELRFDPGGALDGLEAIALKCSDSLEHMIIDFGSEVVPQSRQCDANFNTSVCEELVESGDEPLVLPHIPGLRALTLKGSLDKLQISDAGFTLLASLPTCAPNIEDLTILLSGETSGDHELSPRADTDQALMSLAQLQEVQFDTSSSEGNTYEFESTMQHMLPLASAAGFLTFTYTYDCIWSQWFHPMAFHPMVVFSN